MKKFLFYFTKISLIFAVVFSFSCNTDGKKNQKMPDEPTHKNIVIKNVKVGMESVTENAVAQVDGQEAEVEVFFAENYEGLSVIIAGKPANLDATKKSAKVTIDSITETPKDVEIKATATGKIDEMFTFKVKKGLPLPAINELVFEGKEINPSASTDYQKDQKVYSSDSNNPPLLSEITKDGKHKVGDAKLPTVTVKVRYGNGAEEQKLKVENTTTGKSEETTTLDYNSIKVDVALNAGDNNLVITYSEKGKRPHVYKVIVGYKEAEYEPISVIKFNNEWYSTKEKLEALEKGGEKLSVEGIANVDVKITMPEIWYKENGWQLKVDSNDIQKTDFKKGGYSVIVYTVEKKVALQAGGTKEIKIIFKNTTRSYEKTYKISVSHKVVNKIKSVILVNTRGNVHVDTTNDAGYKFDADKDCYTAKDSVLAEDRLEKGTFLITPEDDAIVPKYVFATSYASPSTLSAWQAMSKKAVTYNKDGSTNNVTTYVIENKELPHGSTFLCLLLEKGVVKTYYVTEIKKDKVKDDNAEKEREERIYQDESGTKVDDNSPLATKALIRVLPKSPRAKKVLLLTPEQKDFTLNTASGYWECTIPLTKRETLYTYKIVAENNTAEKEYKESDQKFTKSVVITDFQFNYKKEGNTWERKVIDEVDGKYYLCFEKGEVKLENKLYLFITGYKGLGVECADFLEKEKNDGYSGTDYTFALNIASLVNGTETKKDYVATLTLNGKNVGTLNLTVYKEDDVIQTVYIGYTKCTQLPNSKYLCKGDIDRPKPKKIEVALYLLPNETPENTNRKIKILENGGEKTVTLNTNEKSKLEFVYKDGITITQGAKIELKIEYYDNKSNSTPTKTYTLNIEDI